MQKHHPEGGCFCLAADARKLMPAGLPVTATLDGALNVKLTTPKELGGAGGEGCNWLTKAQSLRQASNYLLVRFEEEQFVHDEEFERAADFDLNPPDISVVMMLLGFAIENLLKGLYVSTLPNVKRLRTQKELGVTDHSLGTMASKITAALNEPFSKREFKILNGIEQSIVGGDIHRHRRGQAYLKECRQLVFNAFFPLSGRPFRCLRLLRST